MIPPVGLACGLGALSSGAQRSRRKGSRTTEDGADWLEAYLAGSRTPTFRPAESFGFPGLLAHAFLC